MVVLRIGGAVSQSADDWLRSFMNRYTSSSPWRWMRWLIENGHEMRPILVPNHFGGGIDGAFVAIDDETAIMLFMRFPLARGYEAVSWETDRALAMLTK